MKLRRLAPPAASAALPPPSPPPRHQAPRALPLPSAQASSKKRRVSPFPPKTATPVPPPAPALATSAPAATFLSPYSLPQGDTTTEPAYVDSPTAPPPAADEKPSTPSPPAADEEPSTPSAATRPVLAGEARKMKRKVTMIRNPVPEGALAVGKATAAASILALPAGKGCAPDKPSSHRNASLVEEQNASEIEVQKLPSGFNAVDVDETLLGSAKKTLLAEEAVGGGTLISKPAANTDCDACEIEELASAGIGKRGFGMSERQRRRMTEVFVCGLDGSMKEEDVRSVFGWAGEITQVRMAMDARTWKSKGYCFVRYREPSQAKKVVAEFCKWKICWKLCQVEAVDGNDKIVLENIDKKWKKEDIMKLLHKTGVENIDKVTLMADCDNPGYNCGYAFLELETERDAWMAYIKLSRKGVFRRCLNITVAWAKAMSDRDEEMQQVKSIFVEGIPESWDNLKLTEIFSKYGVIQRTVLSHDIQSAKRSDFAFVHYTTHEAAILCLELFDKEELTGNGSKVNIKVSLDKPVRKGKQKKEDTRIISRQKSKTKIAQTCQVQERDDFLQATQGFSGSVPATAPSLPPMLHGNMLPIPVSILRSRLARGQWQVLVRWEGLPASEASWEDVESFQQRCPAFALEDELFLKERRDVMVGMKYHRRQH
ncbi:uncharacterized protein LOC8060739 isoform X2 [Sorghum bicolor]|uniref:Uncharacterized protein n=2 Tax=Sorghum bicolor TaxID=4558 RepID=A0A1W0W2C9_SORBI|nr:uncharacterized protein LOC8060739 isoform X2 [Sorghum bicolor]OQU88540.1 hypothetical protein SORBI_3002G053200 [Sorghum bicolor]OQU88548.1 hypothetical protein SORBI_3002G053200 [Sorghum bicolor]OQU88551.1 hypothetical protein SORBI_3002G053200 [Sorghum bicolor]|eukprot:XP_002461542.2 uncharacterized protein LOC8060739 isoform X2 [Sorghum bicolor]